MNNLNVSIITINYNNAILTSDAINSIIKNSKNFTYEIIVVDNSCSDDEFNKLKKLIGDKARLIQSESNLGFGKGNNLAVSQSRGKYVFFLNNDTLLINNAIFELYDFLEKNENVGIAGSNLYSIDNKPTHSFTYSQLNVTELKKLTKMKSILKFYLFKKRNDFNYSNTPISVGGDVLGASLMISRKDFDLLQGFDKDIFMYGEETLLCYKLIHELNKKVYNVPNSKIIHFEGSSIKEKNKIISPKMAYELANGTYIYFKKAFGEVDAKKMLKIKIKEYKKKTFIAKFFKKNNVQNYITLCNGYKSKYKEVIE